MISDDTILDFAKKCELISPDCNAILHQGDLKEFAQLCFEEGIKSVTVCSSDTKTKIFHSLKELSGEFNESVELLARYKNAEDCFRFANYIGCVNTLKSISHRLPPGKLNDKIVSLMHNIVKLR